MLTVQIDEGELDTRIRDELKKRLIHLEQRHTFWDMKELCKQVCMSENFIKEQFFHDPRFPKVKVGRKWLMPSKATEDFLLIWIQEQ